MSDVGDEILIRANGERLDGLARLVSRILIGTHKAATRLEIERELCGVLGEEGLTEMFVQALHAPKGAKPFTDAIEAAIAT
jgi:hypothetical protein